MPLTEELAELASQFETFAQRECGESPLYGRLAEVTARDPDLLSLAMPGTNTPKVNLFLAAVHNLLLRGADDPLARYYPSRGGDRPVDEQLDRDFRAFCLTHRAEIGVIMETRRVQTNEVARCAYLVPAFQLIARDAPDRPLALVEVGTSAGLLLNWDHYAYEFDGQHLGGESTLTIGCTLAGTGRPLLGSALPEVASRVGIDLNPIEVRNPEESLWLRSLVWGDEPERARRLERAIVIVARDPPRFVQADALEALPELLSRVSLDATLVVFHAHTLNQFTPEGRARFHALLAKSAEQRDLYHLSLEGLGSRQPLMSLEVFRRGEVPTGRDLAHFDAHGGWLEWLAD